MAEDDYPPDGPRETSTRAPTDLTVGTDLSRILSLSDGIFAFAMTLLVLNIALPSFPPGTNFNSPGFSSQLAGALNGHFSAILIYVLTFFVLGTWWVYHDQIFRVIRRYNPGLVRLNLAFLAPVAITPFSLQLVIAYPPTTTGVAWFAGIQAICGVMMFALWSYATARHRLVDADLSDRLIRATGVRALVTVAVFVTAGGIGVLSPLAGLYSMFAVYPVGWLVRFKQRRKTPPAVDSGLALR